MHFFILTDYRRFYGLQLMLSMCVALTACDNAKNTSATTITPPPAKVKIAQPLNQTVSEWHEFTAHIEAVNHVEIRARVSGYLEALHFHAGDAVKKGELLFSIDAKPFQVQLNYAKAQLEQAQSRFALAKNDLARAENLYQAKAIASEEYDARQKAVQETHAAVTAAQAQVETAKLNLSYTEVRAPIDGRISREHITPGNLVSENTLLTTLVSLNPVYVYADMDEQTLLQYRRATKPVNLHAIPVELALADESGFPHSGKLDYIAPSADPSTGTVNVRAVFDNDHELLSPGFFARIRLKTSDAYPALLLPERAIGSDQSERMVWMIADNKAVYRKVVLGAKIGDFRVIKQGLQTGDWVIIEGLQKVRPGSAVEPETLQLSTTTTDSPR